MEIIGVQEETPYFTVVNEVFDDGKLLVDVMRLGGEETRLTVNSKYALRFFTERGVYRFMAILIGYKQKGQYDFMLFNVTDGGEKTQRRKAFRLTCGEEITFANMDDNIENQAGFIRDISSGGVRLLTVHEMDEGKLLRLQLSFIGPGFSAFGAILSKSSVTDVEAKYRYQYGIEFIGLSEPDTEKIISYVHHEQQKQRARK